MQHQGSKRLKNSRYISGFDGIRTLAVIGVIVYHLLPYSLQGGYLGVPIFFVVSGYLITDLLLQEYEQNGRIDLLAFYQRRMKRLYPALVTMVLTTAAYITLFQRSLLVNLKAIITTNLVYVYNWWEIGHGQSYFDRFNGESPFTHLWSLSIEGQFYLIWPVILIILLKKFRERRVLFYSIMAVAGVSAILMALLYAGPDSTNRVYYGTDTRMFAILFGVALAVVWPSTKLKLNLDTGIKKWLNGVGLISLAVIVWLFFSLSGQDVLTYRGGMVLFTLISTVLVATVAHPASFMNRLLTNKVFDWIGQRSYGIYLYQFPIMIFYESKVEGIAAHPWLNALIEVGLILVVSDLSFRFLERPARHYQYSQLPADLKRLWQAPQQVGKQRYWVVPAALVMVVAIFGAIIAPSHAPKTSTVLQTHIKKNQKQATTDNKKALIKQREVAKRNAITRREAKKWAKVKLSPHQVHLAKQYGLSKRQVVLARDTSITAIGDSVMVDVANDIRQVMPNTYVSAAVGRQIWQAPKQIQGLQARGALASKVVINLGTNGPMTQQQMTKVIRMIGPKRHVYWVTAHVPTRNWEGPVNRSIKKIDRQYTNVSVVDWHAYSKNHQNWFYKDHVHPNPTGSRYFTRLLVQTLTTT